MFFDINSLIIILLQASSLDAITKVPGSIPCVFTEIHNLSLLLFFLFVVSPLVFLLELDSTFLVKCVSSSRL